MANAVRGTCLEHGNNLQYAEAGRAYSEREVEWDRVRYRGRERERKSERVEGFIAQDLLLLPRGAKPAIGATPTTSTVAYTGCVSSRPQPNTCLLVYVSVSDSTVPRKAGTRLQNSKLPLHHLTVVVYRDRWSAWYNLLVRVFQNSLNERNLTK